MVLTTIYREKSTKKVSHTSVVQNVVIYVCQKKFPLFVLIQTNLIECFFYKQRIFSTQPQCCLTFPWIQLQMWLRCCLLHISIIKLIQILYLVYFCRCYDVTLFMLYLGDPFLIFSPIFIITNRPISLTHLFCAHLLEYLILVLDDNRNEESVPFSNSKCSASRYCLAFAWFFANFSSVLIIKLLLIKESLQFSSFAVETNFC